MQFPCLTVTGSSRGFSISACRRNTFPRHTRQSMRSKVGMRSRLITPATKLWGEEPDWELFHATVWEESESRGAKTPNRRICIVMSKGLPKSDSWTQQRVHRTTQEPNPKRLSNFSQWAQKRGHPGSSECPASPLFWNAKMNMTPLSTEGWSGTYPSLKGVPLPISLGSKREEDSSNRSGSAICWWCNSAWIHKSINI